MVSWEESLTTIVIELVHVLAVVPGIAWNATAKVVIKGSPLAWDSGSGIWIFTCVIHLVFFLL